MSFLRQDTSEQTQSILSIEQAIDLFDLFANRLDIPFGYREDGCFHRANLMCKTISEIGLQPQKAWAFKEWSPEKNLSVDWPDGFEKKWKFHVAPSLPVRLRNKLIQDVVFDPGLFDGPVSLREWGELMHAGTGQLQIAPFNHVPAGCFDLYDALRAAKIELSDPPESLYPRNLMKEHQNNQTFPRIVFPSQWRKENAPRRPAEKRGISWIHKDL